MARLRRQSSYRRRAPTREPYDYVLIVSEGTKTEPHYFNGLKRAFGLSNANIKVTPADGTDPVSVVKFALAELAADPEFNRAFCVFDRNGHDNYDAALQLLAQSPPGQTGMLMAVTSWPCFELWILLHFVEPPGPFQAAGGRSACDNALREVRTHYPDYVKGHHSVFEELAEQLPTAIARARRLSRDNQRTQSTNPSTRVHELATYLRGLKPR